MAPARTLLHLVRHGQTEWNAARRVQGQTNSDLTAVGQAQADALARGFSERLIPSLGEAPSALYASDLGRAVQTAAPIGRALDLEIRTDPGLREMGFGALEGLSWTEVEASHPEISLHLWGDNADPTIRAPDGESRSEMHDRSAAALRAICERHLGSTVVAVSHGGVIGFFLRGVLGIPFHLRPGFSTPNCAVASFRYQDGRFKLLLWGWTPPAATE